jgi:cell filamentation protein
MADPYVYPGTTVLMNKYDERDQVKLNAIEAAVVWPEFIDIYSAGVSENVPLSVGLHQAVHKHLFERVYPFAGKFRTMDIAKAGEIQYAAVAFLHDSAEKVWRDINRRFATPPESLEAAIEPLVESMGDLHVLHPFREGNTRTLQLVIREIAWRAGFNIQWVLADPTVIRNAGTAAAVGDNAPYTEMLRKITKPIGRAPRKSPLELKVSKSVKK